MLEVDAAGDAVFLRLLGRLGLLLGISRRCILVVGLVWNPAIGKCAVFDALAKLGGCFFARLAL